MQKLRQIYLALGISDCSMEEGSMRCDGNVSLRRRGAKEFGVKTELKNMNSFKNLHDGLAYEICRQAEVLEEGGQIFQETRHWDPSKKRTIVMRVKETADDYRLFPLSLIHICAGSAGAVAKPMTRSFVSGFHGQSAISAEMPNLSLIHI